MKDKIKIAEDTIITLKDYIEVLKLRPKLKQTFNIQVIEEQIALNEKKVLDNSKKLIEKL